MKLLIHILISTCLLTVSAWGQTRRAETSFGPIVDSYGNHIEGATISNANSREIAFTNEQGYFILKQKLSSLDSLKISAIGFQTLNISAEKITASNKLILQQNPVQLEEVSVASVASNRNHVISKLDIKMQGINNAQEALRIVPGLFIGQHAGGGKAEQIFLRGFDIDHGTDINITVDGMPVNMVSHAHGQGYADLHFVIPELIDNVQFQKGLYQPEKGNFTTAGFVDFKTKNNIQKNSIKLEAGQFNTYRGLAQINLLKPQNNNRSLYVASELMYTKGYFDAPQNFNRLNLFAKYNGQVGVNNKLTISASTFKSKWNASGQIPQRSVDAGDISFFGAIDPNEGGITSRSNLNAQLTTTLNNTSFIKNQLYFTAYDFELYSNFTFFLEDKENGDQIKQKENRSLFGYNGSYQNIGFLGAKKWTTEAGVSIRVDDTKDSELSHTKAKTTTINSIQLGDISEVNPALYVNQTLELSRDLTLQTGLRFDQFFSSYKDKLDNNKVNRNNASIFSPKVSLHYHPNSKTEFYLASGKGFHSNDTRVTIEKRREILPAAYGTDLGVNTKPFKNVFVNLAVWQLYLQQEFVYVGDAGIVEPSGKTNRIGADLSIRYQPCKNLFIDVNANHSKARALNVAKGENYLPLSPNFTSTGGVTYKSERGFNGSLRYRYMGDRPANEDYSAVAKGYFISDAFVAYTKPKFEWSISAQNIFDARWKETQFLTESQLKNEPAPVEEIHFTPGTPFFIKTSFTYFF